MYHKPKVSIIIPCYNSEKYVEKAVQSARKQSLKEIEIILIDDGSIDKTAILLQHYKMEDNRIVVVFNKKNTGLGPSRNSGIKRSTGEYIYFLDSDDYMHPNSLEVLYEQAKTENLDILQSRYAVISGNKKNTRQSDFISLEKPLDGISYFHQNFFVSPMACSKLFKTDFLKTNNIIFPNRYYEDMTFTFEAIIKANRISHNLMPTYFYQLRKNSISNNFGNKNVEDYKQVLTELQSYFMNDNLIDKNSTFPIHFYLFLTRFSRNVIQNCKPETQKEIKYFVNNLAKKYKQYISTNNRYPFIKRMILQKSPFNYAFLSLKLGK